MLAGHVDRVSHCEISGWAADTERPYETVEVSIFVAGCKRAQVACNLASSGLQQTHIWSGEGHGFRFNFPAALGRDATHLISVRFTATGRELNGGEVRLSPDGVTTMLSTRDNSEIEGMLKLPLPTTPRETFLLFPLYQPTYGLSDLLARIDFTARRPRDIHYAVLGTRSAKVDRLDEFGASYTPREYMNELLMSPAFQQELATVLLDAFPEKRRLLFVHIPRCAGTHLSRQLMSRYPSLNQPLMEERRTSKDALFTAVRDLVRALPLFDSIFVRGHIQLNWYLDRELVRPIDRLFTIIRDPVEIAVSQANYVMTRIVEDLESGKVEPDTQHWLGLVGLREIPTWPLADLAGYVRHKVLHTPEIVLANPLCQWLGGGEAATVLNRLAQSGAEVTETTCYSQWLLETWGIRTTPLVNESRKFISKATLDRAELDYLAANSAEDVKLFRSVQQRLAAFDRSWLTGSQLCPIKD